MKNAVEKWERLGVTPPRDELQVAAVGLTAARSAVTEGPTVNEALASADAMSAMSVEPPPVIGAQTESLTHNSQKHFRVEAAHTHAPVIEKTEDTFVSAGPHVTKSSPLSQRMQRVQETCARLLPIKGRSSTGEAPSTASWIMKLLFHPEAVVVLLLIVACFLAIVILDPGEPENAELAVAPKAEQKTAETPAPTAEAPVVETTAESALPPIQAAPVVPELATAPMANTPPPAANAGVSAVEAQIAEAPVAQPPAPSVPSAAPVVPPATGTVPQVAQAMPPVARSPEAAPSQAPLTVTEGATPPVQNPTVVNISPHANTYPTTSAPQSQGSVNGVPQATMPPQAATNMPAVIGPQASTAQQANVWPQGGSPMFEGPPSSPGSGHIAISRPEPKRILNHTYTPGTPAASMPAANLSAYPPTVSPELYWQPQHVAQRPPQPRSNPGAAQLQGIIQQPQSGNLHEHY